MDPNEQEADEDLMKAEDAEDTAEVLRAQGDEASAFKIEQEAQEMKEGGEQQKMDTEGLINQGMAQQRQRQAASGS